YMTYLQAQVMNCVPPLYPPRSLAMARTAAAAALLARSPGSSCAATGDQRRSASLRAACSSTSYRRALAASRSLRAERSAPIQSCGSPSALRQVGAAGLLSGRASAILGCYLSIHQDFTYRFRKPNRDHGIWLTALVKTRLRRTHYRPGLLGGFLANAGLDLTPFL